MALSGKQSATTDIDQYHKAEGILFQFGSSAVNQFQTCL